MPNTDKAQMDITVLVVEDDPDLREALCDTLSLAGIATLQSPSAEKALQELALHKEISLVVSDVNMGAMNGHDLLREVKTRYSHIPVLLITAYACISESVEAIKGGAVDYLVKPFESAVLLEAVKKFTGLGQVQDDEPIAQSASSQQLLQLARRLGQTDTTVLINGESGSGKEVLARYIHTHSNRASGPFVAVNCAAIPENMLEAMLFGHEKGAYTGAYNSAPGKFEQANGGTLLLDEVSEMDLGLQAKLLRVLQEREVERLGGRKTISLDVRVVATSNRDMGAEVKSGKFREDLYYRLSVLPLQCLPLRERTEDIPPLARRLIQRHAVKQRRLEVTLSDDAMEALLQYSWPGNVRELDNVMQRALILQPGLVIEEADLGLGIEGGLKIGESLKIDADVEGNNQNIRSRQEQNSMSFSKPVVVEMDTDAGTGEQTESAPLGKDLKQREYEIIVNTLKQLRGSKKQTAEQLGISPRTLRYKIARLKEQGLNVDQAILSN